MKQKSGGIKRLMEFTGKHRGLLTVSRILSGISSVLSLDRSSAFTLQRVTWWAYLPGRR